MSKMIVLAVLVCAAVQVADAGCYGSNPRPERPFHFEAHPHANVKATPAFVNLPEHFDWCNLEDGRTMCTPSWNQHIPVYCGSCYAHGTLSAIQDRMMISTNGTRPGVMLARQTFLNCAHKFGLGNGCNGGAPEHIFEYMRRIGLPDESCMTYKATDFTAVANMELHDAHPDSCHPELECLNCFPIKGDKTCWAVKNPIRYRVKSWGHVSGEQAMMAEIAARGPITCGIASQDDFAWNYHGGIYNDLANSTAVDHDIEVVGWGVEDGVKYWKGRNSWGTYWGEDGFFRIIRGENNLMIESECAFAIPDTMDQDKVYSGVMRGSMDGLLGPEELGAVLN